MRIEHGGWIIDQTMDFKCGSCGMERPLPYGVKATCGCGAELMWYVPSPEEWEKIRSERGEGGDGA